MDPKPKVLCVDDEPNVLEGLTLQLGRRVQLFTATSGAAALDLLKKEEGIAVIITDMRMPLMDGAALLAKARVVAPDASRVLLTGHADVASAVAAVNDGHILRFLTKPCAPPILFAALDAALEHHRLITAERVLLEQTLAGSVKTLFDVLSLTSPLAFGRAGRVKKTASEIAAHLKIPGKWQLDVAAMLGELGVITLPAEVAEKAYFDQALTPTERAMVDRVPAATQQLLANIARLDGVRAIVAQKPRDDKELFLSRILRAATELDQLEMRGQSRATAVATLRGREGGFPPAVLDAMSALYGGGTSSFDAREVSRGQLHHGMLLAEDLRLHNDVLIAPRGYEVTPSFIARLGNFPEGAVREPIRVIVPPPRAEREVRG